MMNERLLMKTHNLTLHELGKQDQTKIYEIRNKGTVLGTIPYDCDGGFYDTFFVPSEPGLVLSRKEMEAIVKFMTRTEWILDSTWIPRSSENNDQVKKESMADATLHNDEESTDEELIEYLQREGKFTEQEAKKAVAQRSACLKDMNYRVKI